jgi:hypothetical protein
MCNCGKRFVPSVKTQVPKQIPRSLGIKPNGTVGYGVTPRTNTRRAIIRTK